MVDVGGLLVRGGSCESCASGERGNDGGEGLHFEVELVVMSVVLMNVCGNRGCGEEKAVDISLKRWKVTRRPARTVRRALSYTFTAVSPLPLQITIMAIIGLSWIGDSADSRFALAMP